MEKSTIIAGAAVVGGISLVYWLTRKKDQTGLGADYESASPGQSPPSDSTFFDYDLAEVDYESSAPGQEPPSDTTFYSQDLADEPDLRTRWTADRSRKQFFHEPHGHWCYMTEPNSLFKDSWGSMYDRDLCQRRPNFWLPSRWTEAQVDAFMKQRVGWSATRGSA